MDKHVALTPCPFCGAGLTLDIDEDGGIAILHSLKGEKNCWFPSVVEIEMPVGTTLDEMAEIINRRPTQESYEHALVGASLVAAARLQDKDFEIQDLKAELARRDEERADLLKKNKMLHGYYAEQVNKRVYLEDKLRRRDEIITRLKEVLPTLKISHYYCEDCWYSCPKEEDGCCNEAEGEDCNCGADEHNSKIDALMKELE